MNRTKNIFIAWLIKKSGGICVSFSYVGDKGKSQVHSTSFLHYNPFKDEFIIDWTNKEIKITTRK